MPSSQSPFSSSISRREAFQTLASGTLGAQIVSLASTSAASAQDSPVAAGPFPLKQSIAHWCFARSTWKWSLERTCEEARKLGCESVELITPDNMPTVAAHSLTCAMVSLEMPPGVRGFEAGWNNPQHWEMLQQTTTRSLEAAARMGAPNVIAFVGMRAKDLKNAAAGEFGMEEGADNCVEGLKRVASLAEKTGVTICLEMLNSRDGTAPMLGHPGYQGDHVDYCIRILERIGSPRIKLLFDVYHVQIMDGDVIHRIRQYAPWIGHIHTAGVPGRGELDDTQEVHYRGIAATLLEVGYKGFVGHEFMPTRDPVGGLKEAISVCSGVKI